MNGCGPWWVPYRWKDYYFDEECNLHDREYAEGLVDRNEADRRFFVRMVKKIDQEPNRWTRQRRRAQAVVFYYLVRRLGFLFYRRS